MKQLFYKYWGDALAVMLFVIMSFAYFYPADTEGRVLYRHDASAGRGMGEEASQYKQQTGETTRWTNSAFGGMPTYQTAPSYDSTKPLVKITEVYHLGLPEYVWYLFAYLLGFYILLRAFNFRWHLAVLGSVLWSLSSYFLIIIAAGHIWKVMALAYLPPMIGGVVLCFRGKWLWGFIVTALFAAMEVNANHVQMTYYYLFIILFMVIAFLVEAIQKKELMRWVKAAAVCGAAAIVGILMNISNLYHTWEYQKESMRGKSELVKEGRQAQNQTSSGLDRDYITQWSYGGDEMLTLLIPNANGGAHDIKLGDNEKAMEVVDEQAQGIVAQWYQYWGEQPYTAGPVYVGAFVMFLFFLGFIIVDGPMKWAMVCATVLSMLLSLGHNLMPVTDFFIDYIPMYAKFRTVSSILVIAEFCIPLLAMMALKKLYDEPDYFKGKTTMAGKTVSRKWTLLFPTLLTAGVCLFIGLFPDVMPHLFSQSDAANMQKYGIPADYVEALKPGIIEARKVVLSADCWRSLWIIIVGMAILAAYHLRKVPAWAMVGGITVLCLFDMWQVDKRYLYDDMFVNAEQRVAAPAMSETDKAILEDTSLDYRVLNFARSTFNENETSFYHKSIGGYHAAKLRRYQEVIDNHISPEMRNLMSAIYKSQGDMSQVSERVAPAINMLNTKYFILPIQGGQTVPVVNPYAMGNAWFVNSVEYVDNANKEIGAIGHLDLKNIAVADKKYEDVLGTSAANDSTAMVSIKEYLPNNLKYEAYSQNGGVVVFSEIYYPGWTATIDGKEAELGRVNYILRALKVPAGKHEIVLDFHPQTVKNTETIANIANIILLLAVVAVIALAIRKNKKRTDDKAAK